MAISRASASEFDLKAFPKRELELLSLFNVIYVSSVVSSGEADSSPSIDSIIFFNNNKTRVNCFFN